MIRKPGKQPATPPSRIYPWAREIGTTLSFHSLLFQFYQGKTSNLLRIFSHCRTHKILGKDRENTKITKEIPRLKLTKEILKTKEWKDRAVVKLAFVGRETVHVFGPRYTTILNPKAGAGSTEVECRTPTRSTGPNSCSTGPALWE